MTRTRGFVVAGLLVALVLAGGVSFYASASPDGLERVAEDQGISTEAREHDLAGSPLADYGTAGVDDTRISGAVAGVAGVGLTFLVFGGITYLLRRRTHRRAHSQPGPLSSSAG